MNQLVFIQNNHVVTDSLTIAEMFGKEHKNVLRDINTQLEYAGTEFSQLNFEPSEYESRGKQYPKFNLSEEAFTLVVFSYNTKEAVQTKIKFIQEFKRMREHIKNQEQQLQDPVELALQTALQTHRSLKNLETDVNYLKDSMRIDGIQQKAIQSSAKAKAMQALGGHETKAYKDLSSKVFRSIWKEFNTYFQLPRYGELPKAKYDDALYFISKWRPSTTLEIEIEACNKQEKFHLV
ncbi:ORF6C domain-containing protein [Lysinibacillus sp. OL1_EC]|uniref:Rha family transcriptional regulator n=1 Tax=unclassified Lysinibacillus TaxID=2636778 RepID=UPI00103EB44C|nr:MULTISPECIES: ORF6C domain-containing protein [unclassified Lysinibacillus]MCM0626486.1 ORF6C domain-containing protein [Lysinibacillus sp. OL1_EC]TBV85649.1 Rha family transcriptional regulator [Lysinibacillus sp. OL1]